MAEDFPEAVAAELGLEDEGEICQEGNQVGSGGGVR